MGGVNSEGTGALQWVTPTQHGYFWTAQRRLRGLENLFFGGEDNIVLSHISIPFRQSGSWVTLHASDQLRHGAALEEERNTHRAD